MQCNAVAVTHKPGRTWMVVAHTSVIVIFLQAMAGALCNPDLHEYVSTNDAIASLFWLLMCTLRKKPLPGQSRGPDHPRTALHMAVDLRTAIAKGATAMQHAATTFDAPSPASKDDHGDGAVQLPLDYFGNAAWSLQINACIRSKKGSRHCSSKGAAVARGKSAGNAQVNSKCTGNVKDLLLLFVHK